MSEVKWIKITIDMFSNRKITHLRKLPDGNNIVLIWVMLLTMAGRCNAGGMIFLTENIPYTAKMLADELNFEESTISLALEAMERLNMISRDDGCFRIAGWDEYQNIDKLSEIREYNRAAKQKSRLKQTLSSNVNDMSMTCQPCQSTDRERDKEEDRDREEDKDREKRTESITPPPPCSTAREVLSSFNFGEELHNAVYSWLEYKHEKKQDYKQTGLKVLLGQIEKAAGAYGDEAVIETIKNCIASNYMGITFDRMKTGNQPKDRMAWVYKENYDDL